MNRKNKLAAVLRNARLVTRSAIALRVVNTASNPDCTVAEIAEQLSQDPILCGKVLKAVNSCVFTGGRQPIATVDRAIVVLGLNPLRSLVLGLSLPVAQAKADTNPATKDFWIDAVSGGILAKELSVHREGASPGYDLVAGLLRDLGTLLLAQFDPLAWAEMLRTHAAEYLTDPCAVEDRVFGIHHVDVTTALLTSWKLPDDVIEPIRHHHQPEALAAGKKAWRERAELLHFVESLVRLDQVAESPSLLKGLLSKAMILFGLGQEALIEFLEKVSPKIEALKQIFDVGLQDSRDYSAILGRGCEALVNLSFRSQFQFGAASRHDSQVGTSKVSDLHQTIDHPSRLPGGQAHAAGVAVGPPPLPKFKLEHVTQFPAGGCQLDQYELREELGRGAMGVVYAGLDAGVQREVAIKMMSPTFAASQDGRLRFAREARTLAAIHHKNIVGIYSLGSAEGLPYLAMEFVHGGSLEELVEGVGPLPVKQIVELGCQIAAGLAAAHEKGIVHRDLKPANIMIEAISDTIKIADFGLARGTDNLGLTQAGALIGSPAFMSPEQIEGHPVDARSDLFSLGSVFYYLCTAALPFEATSMAALLRMIDEANPIRPRTLRPDLPIWLDCLLMDLLQKRRADRVPSADALYARLAKHR